MPLISASLSMLKRQARRMARADGIALHAALDRIAMREGFARWSLLAARSADVFTPETLYRRLAPGDLLLVAARPGEGKTLLGYAMAEHAIMAGHHGFVFSLESSQALIRDHFHIVLPQRSSQAERLTIDCSNGINADHIIRVMDAARPGSLAAIDYLQLLDQRRDNPDLATQVRALKAFARERGVILVVLSQIDRAFVDSGRRLPGLADVRLPNPLDLGLFDKAVFLSGGQMSFEVV